MSQMFVDYDNEEVDIYSNPFEHIEPSMLNSYFQHNSDFSPKFNQSTLINCEKYLDFINNSQHSTLYDILNSQPTYTYKQFYSLATKNFIKFNEHELSFISKNFSPKQFKHDILNYVITGEEYINRSQFINLLNKEFIEDFNDLYVKGLLAKYALDNFSLITKEEQSQLWQKLDLHLSNNFNIKNIFFNKALELNVKITDPIFFKNTDLHNNNELTSYFIMAVNNQWSDNIIYFSKHFPNTCVKYQQRDKDFTTKENVNFERLFLYFNPDKINASHLSSENIDFVFSKLYNNLAEKDLLHVDNSKLVKSLGLGIYKFLEIANTHDEENIDKFLRADNYFLFNQTNVNQRFSNLNSLLINIEKINPHLQESFHRDLLYKYLPEIFKDLKSTIIYNNSEDSFLFKVLVQESYITSSEKNALIHVLLENFINNPDSDKTTFFNKLSKFNVDSLENFTGYMEFSLNILKTNSIDSEDSINYVEQTFNKILLNVRLHNKIKSETEEKKEKRPKI